MSFLVRQALETVYEDELDAIAGDIGYAEYLANPSSSVSWTDFVTKMRAKGHLT